MRTTSATRRWALLLALLGPALAPAYEVDTTLRDFLHARSHGTGGAFRAVGLGADTVSGNPAAMSLFRRYQTEVSGAWEFGGRLAFGTISIMDSSTNRLAVGISYHFAQIGRATHEVRSLHMETLAVALPLSDAFHLGISARHLLMSGTPGANAITGDAGIIVRPFPALHLGISGHNLVPIPHREARTFYVASAAWVGHLFHVAADLRADLGATPLGGDPTVVRGLTPVLGFSVGGEYLFGIVPVRAGFQTEGLTGAKFLSAGIGVMTETGNVDLAYRQQIGGNARLIALTLRLGS